MDLDIDFSARSLNGRKIPARLWPDIVGMMADQQKINSISLSSHKIYQNQTVPFQGILDLLKENGLQQLTKFQTNYHFPELEQLLSICPKLSVLQLQFGLRLSAPTEGDDFPSLDLSRILKDKAITELDIRVFETTVEELLKLFRAIKPNKLRKLKLSYVDFCSIDMSLVMREMADSSWAALEEIKITGGVNGQLDVFNAALVQLRSMRNCHVCLSVKQIDQVFSGILSLLNISPRPKRLVTDYLLYPFGLTPKFLGCQIVEVVQQLHREHQTLAIDFGKRFLQLQFALGNVLVRLPLSSTSDGCEQCRSFYPIVLNSLVQQAKCRGNAHMGEFVLDRCRVERVVADLNKQSSFTGWKALSVDEIEDQDLVTITFEKTDLSQFYISLKTGHCFTNNPCVKCVVIA